MADQLIPGIGFLSLDDQECIDDCEKNMPLLPDNGSCSNCNSRRHYFPECKKMTINDLNEYIMITVFKYLSQPLNYEMMNWCYSGIKIATGLERVCRSFRDSHNYWLIRRRTLDWKETRAINTPDRLNMYNSLIKKCPNITVFEGQRAFEENNLHVRHEGYFEVLAKHCPKIEEFVIVTIPDIATYLKHVMAQHGEHKIKKLLISQKNLMGGMYNRFSDLMKDLDFVTPLISGRLEYLSLSIELMTIEEQIEVIRTHVRRWAVGVKVIRATNQLYLMMDTLTDLEALESIYMIPQDFHVRHPKLKKINWMRGNPENIQRIIQVRTLTHLTLSFEWMLWNDRNKSSLLEFFSSDPVNLKFLKIEHVFGPLDGMWHLMSLGSPNLETLKIEFVQKKQNEDEIFRCLKRLRRLKVLQLFLFHHSGFTDGQVHELLDALPDLTRIGFWPDLDDRIRNDLGEAQFVTAVNAYREENLDRSIICNSYIFNN